MSRVYSSTASFFTLKRVVHIIGTNGKGTTGRFLTQICQSNGLKVGHYTSPHIFNFNERIYINGKNIDDSILESLHEETLNILKKQHVELSYFEYTTFLAFLAFKDCDIVILEAGLGGEYDATNVVKKELSIVTPIGVDHQELLGENITQIAKTKLNSVNNSAIIAHQEYNDVKKVIKQREDEISEKFIYVNNEENVLEINEYATKHNLPTFLKDNLLTAYHGAKFLKLDTNISKLQKIDLSARFQKIAPNITIDVGHNPLAAEAILKSFKGEKITLIYNSYIDKDFKSILKILQPIIKNVELIEIKNPQREDATIQIKEFLKSLHVEYSDFKKIDKNSKYLVFGSFSVVENFMKEFHKK